MAEFGIFNWFGYHIPMAERAALIRTTGFKHVMIWWGDDFIDIDGPKEAVPDVFRNAGLRIAGVHLPFKGINNIWLDNVEGAAVFENLHNCLQSCKEHKLPMAVLHVSGGHHPPPFSEIGVKRFQALADLAARDGVILTLENLRRLDYLDYVFAKVQSETLGFCYDSGHDLLYAPKPYLLLDQYGHKLQALHLHDNHGIFDEHLVPGEGYIDWPLVKAKLQTWFKGPYMLECQNYGENVKKISPADYLAKAYNAALKLLS